MGWSGPMTHRQYLGWQAWLAMQWERPSRADYYAMQTASEVRYMMHERPRDSTLEPFHIRWQRDQQKITKPQGSVGGGTDNRTLTPEQQARRSKAILGAYLKVKIPKGDKQSKNGD